MGDVDGALENYGRALSLREQVAAADLHDARAQETVARALRGAGRLANQIQVVPPASRPAQG